MIVKNLPKPKIKIYKKACHPKGYRTHYVLAEFLCSKLSKRYEMLLDYTSNSYILFRKCFRYETRKRLQLNSTLDFITWSIVRTSKYSFRAVRTDYLLFTVNYISGSSAKDIINKITNFEFKEN